MCLLGRVLGLFTSCRKERKYQDVRKEERQPMKEGVLRADGILGRDGVKKKGVPSKSGLRKE